MENFIVSARKYRPQTFDTVVGQKSITNTLKNAIKNNQLAQAFLFCGPRGVGKTTCARILAKTINCEHLTLEGEACDNCQSCLSFNESSSFNIYELDGASNNSVDEIRNLVDKVRIPPQMGKYKVYIIDEVHMLTTSAFNAFLKTLEEPPPYAKFILATTEKHKIIPTILSRCQIFDFKRITVEDIARHLSYVANTEHIEAEEHALHIIAQKADGAMRDALSIFDQLVSFSGNSITYDAVLENLNVLDYEYFFKITDQIIGQDISGTLLTINEIFEKGFDGQHFIIGFGEHLRNLLVCRDPVTVKLLETAPNIRVQYQEQASRCVTEKLLQLLDINNKCDLNYKISNNKKLHLELALMQMCSIQRVEMHVSHSDPSIKPAVSRQIPAPDYKPPQVASPSPVRSESTKPLKERSFPGTISIKESTGTSVKEPDPVILSKVTQDLQVEPETPFSQEELDHQWGNYVATLPSESAHLISSLKKNRPLLQPEFSIEFSVDNKLVEDELNQIRNEMVGYLRKTLDNTKINVLFKVIESNRVVKPYTDKEKFMRMAEKNPAILDLRDQLNLEID
ncbi:MAG: DNA polymerase III subunit gamma/tau [Bacteroidota bacterium]